MRFGLLMFTAMMTTGNVLSRIGGFSDPGYAMGAVPLGIAFALVPGAFRFLTATRGRKGTAWLDG